MGKIRNGHLDAKPADAPGASPQPAPGPVPDAMLELQDKVALITGAARRIGAAIVRRLHARGASVLLHHRGSAVEAGALEAELNALRPNSVWLVKADLLALKAPELLVRSALERFGRLDLLVNNASSFFPTPVGEIDAKIWEELAGPNVMAPLLLSQAAAPALAQARGSIVNIIDIHSERPLKGYVVYSIAKAGLAAQTRSLAMELAPEVRVNGVSPGAIAWPEDGQFEPAERERIVEDTLLQRLGEPEDIARAVQFLAFDAPYVTGQVLAVDGGRSINI